MCKSELGPVPWSPRRVILYRTGVRQVRNKDDTPSPQMHGMLVGQGSFDQGTGFLTKEITEADYFQMGVYNIPLLSVADGH